MKLNGDVKNARTAKSNCKYKSGLLFAMNRPHPRSTYVRRRASLNRRFGRRFRFGRFIPNVFSYPLNTKKGVNCEYNFAFNNPEISYCLRKFIIAKTASLMREDIFPYIKNVYVSTW